MKHAILWMGLASSLMVGSVWAGERPLRVNTVEERGFTIQELAKLESAKSVLERVLNSAEFRARVLGFKCDVGGGFVDENGDPGATPAQVLSAIDAARETWNPDSAGSVDLKLSIYTPPFWRRRAEVGHTNMATGEIAMNRVYFTEYDESDVAENLGHEWMHTLGFTHAYRRTFNRHCSVPYAIGQLINELGRKE